MLRLGLALSPNSTVQGVVNTLSKRLAATTDAAIGLLVDGGFLFAVIGTLLLGGSFIFRNPPPPRNDGGELSELNFGR